MLISYGCTVWLLEYQEVALINLLAFTPLPCVEDDG